MDNQESHDPSADLAGLRPSRRETGDDGPEVGGEEVRQFLERVEQLWPQDRPDRGAALRLRDPRLEELLSRCEALKNEGKPVSPAEVCRDCPELLPELQRCWQAIAAMQGVQAGTGNQENDRKTTPERTGPEEGPHRYLPPVPAIPGYEVLGVLGQGGMGVVYKARQVRANRLVALKMILRAGQATGQHLARFRIEAEAAARLQHAGIAQVYEVGEQDGQPFFSLEFCAGGSLKDRLREGPLPAEEAARVVALLADALAEAHARRVLHRDLKPANVLLVDGPDKPVSQCRPKIADFGLAKKLDDPGLTATEAVMGTPSYMAPEQAAGKVRELGPACDIYALGAILYECLTGRPPFQAATPFETLKLVENAEPVPPRRLNPAVPRDLETVCLKCLAKEPQRRYATARELAEELGRFLKGEPVRARPVRSWERGWKWVKRHPAPAALLALIALALLAGPLALLWHNAQLHEAFTLADQQRSQAQTNADETRQQLYAADLRHAYSLFKMGNILDLQKVLDRQRPDPLATEDRRGFEWSYLAGHAQPRRAPLRFPSEGTPRLLAYSPDGRYLIAALHTGESSRIQVWDRTSGQLCQRTTVSVSPFRGCPVALSPDGATVAILAHDGHLVYWDVLTGKEKNRFALQLDGSWGTICLSFTADSRLVGVGLWMGTFRFWDCASGKEAFSLPSEYHVTSLAIAGDGQSAVISAGRNLSWWDLTTRRKVQGVLLPELIHSPVFSPDSRWLALGVQGQGVYLGSVAFRGPEILQVENSKGPWALAFSPDNRTLAIGSRDGTIRFWDVQERRELCFVRWQSLAIATLAFSPDGQELAAGTSDGLVHRLRMNVRPAWERWVPATQVTGEGTLALAPDGKTLAVVVSPRAVQLLDVATRQLRTTLETYHGQVSQLAFTSDSRTLATMRPQVPFVRFWDAPSGQLKRQLSLPENPVVLALSPSGKLLATSNARSNPCCALWDAETGEQRTTFPGKSEAVTKVLTFSPDGSILAAGGSDGTVCLWDVAAMQADPKIAVSNPPAPFAQLKHPGAITAITFAPKGGMMAVSPGDRTAHLWQLPGSATPQLRCKLENESPFHDVQFSADGQHLLTAGGDRYQVWDIRTRSCHHDLDLAYLLLHATLSPDGKAMATTSRDGGVQWWELATWTVRPLGSSTLAPVRSLAVMPDGRTVITGSAMPIWCGRTQELEQLARMLNINRTAIFHSTPWHPASAGLLFWDAAAGQEKPGLPGPLTMAPPERIALSRDGRILAAGGRDGSAWVWDLEKAQKPRRLFVSKEARDYTQVMELGRVLKAAAVNYPEAVQALDLTPDGQTLALASSNGSVILCDTSGQLQNTLPEAQKDIQWVRFSPDGQTLACNAGGQVRLWNVQTARLGGALGEVTDSLSLCATFSPDGRLLVSGTIEQGLRTWDLVTRKERTPLVGHLGRVTAVAFAADGKTLASGSWDRTVRLWNVAAWQEVAILEGHKGNVTCLAFSPKGDKLLSGGDAVPGEVLCWRAAP